LKRVGSRAGPVEAEGQVYCEVRYRERIVWNLTQPAEKLSMRLIDSSVAG
jgi:hypothetical protein